MSSDYLNRDGAPLSAKTWEALERVMVGAAKSQLTARRFLALEGPYGLGVRTIPLADAPTDTGLVNARFLPLQFIFKLFNLGIRDVAAFERDQLVLDSERLARAAIDCARAEDSLLLRGSNGIAGLMTAPGVGRAVLTAWDQPGRSAADAIVAVTALDKAGFHGPYALAIVPERYNLLLRRYPDGNGTELEHLEKIVGGGVFKAPALTAGGVLVATGAAYSAIVLGQDMSLGFVGQVAENIELSISESLALHLREPRAVCVLEE